MSTAIRTMFDTIAGRYDLLNRVLSSGRDQGWRRKAVGLLPQVTEQATLLDLCGGTGDFTLAYQKRGLLGVCFLGDFSRPMVKLGMGKSELRNSPAVMDALKPPFRNTSFDRVLCGFGMRNLDDVEQGIRIVYTLLKPGGYFLTLEFFRPTNGIARFFYQYMAPRLMPLLGKLLGSRSSAYAYLAQSVNGFCTVSEYQQKCQQAGFTLMQRTPFDFGVVHAVLLRKEE